MISTILSAKQVLVGTAAEKPLQRLRWWAGTWQRFRHPELWDMYLEPKRMDAALVHLLDVNSNCVDVGAHVGSALARIIELAPDGRHLAIEPVPHKAQSLRQRFPSVPVVNAAVSSEPGTATLYEARQSGFSSLQPPVDKQVVDTFHVDVVRLDDLVDADHRVHFVKLDVEGAELPALQGAAHTLKREHPVVLFECGPSGRSEPFGYTRADLFGFLADLDYSVYSIVDFVYGRAAMTVAEFEKAGTYPYPGFNYLAVPPNHEVDRLLA